MFATSETAVVAARRSRLERRAVQGDARAAAALEGHPTDFLSAGRIGVTLIGIALLDLVADLHGHVRRGGGA